MDPNALRKLRADFDSDADILDLTTWVQAYKDVGETVKAAETNIELPDCELNERQQVIIDTLMPLLAETSKSYQEAIWELLKTQPINGKIADHIRKHGFDLPEFSFHGESDALPFLEATQYKRDDVWIRELSKSELLLRFQLPKPLARFWQKGGKEAWNQLVNLGSKITEWGVLYQETLPIIWKLVGKIECETNFQIERLNALGHHDPKSFYYLWRVR